MLAGLFQCEAGRREKGIKGKAMLALSGKKCANTETSKEIPTTHGDGKHLPNSWTSSRSAAETTTGGGLQGRLSATARPWLAVRDRQLTAQPRRR